MTDLHTHLLPGFDDGAKDIEETMDLLAALRSQGVGVVVLTPHYYSHEESPEEFLARRRATFSGCETALKACGLQIRLGAEVYLTKYLTLQKRLERLCFEGTRYMLVEFPYDDVLRESVLKVLGRILDNGIIPIIAHAERYGFVRNDLPIVSRFMRLGCRIQINITSLFNKGNQKTALKLLKEGWVDFIASDCHNKGKRFPVFDSAIPLIEKKFGSDTVARLINNSDAVFC